jgi:hypothetical protein
MSTDATPDRHGGASLCGGGAMAGMFGGMFNQMWLTSSCFHSPTPAALETGLWPMEALNPMRRAKQCLLF